MTYFIENYGCEMNIAESAAVEQILIKRGWKKADDVQLTDLVIINTCSVRGSAEERIFGRLGFFTGLKKVRKCSPDAKYRHMETAAEYVKKNGPVPLTVIVMGCMAERLLKELKKMWPVVDYVVGTFGKEKFNEIIPAIEKNDVYEMGEIEPVYKFAESYYEENAFSTFVPIMHGCNNFCTYCIVPYLRGREISRSVNDILHELDILSERKVREICLLGQNVNSYNDNGVKFPQLLKIISKHLDEIKSSIEWIRFESSHPKDFSDELIEVIKTDRKICRGIHLAVQHGSSEVLRRMNRKYTREDYISLIKKLRESVPDVEVTTDIMLGFPGETEAEFEEAYSLMKEIEYESAFMYFYNPREGTPAEKMENQVPLEIKKERLQKIIDLQLEITQKVMKRRVGKTIKVLADIVSKDNQNELLGKTEQNERVAFKADPKLIGSFVTVKLESLNGNTFKGTLV
ncbi:MAG: tRNA (N6-isopentenyl adenosine(37)-C2)-methylthiotransferase MiaB [Treponema sp.]|nr:tRNA (N6-isopentenyl adenosine(37)-C2)-methylthiotransferase MiaB [Treponema sp.]